MLERIAGSSSPLVIRGRNSVAVNDVAVVTISGPYALVAAAQPAYGSTASPCPSGYTVESSDLVPDNRGGATLTIRCVRYGSSTDSGFAPQKTLFTIQMVEESYQLESHPAVVSDIGIIKQWLASDPSVQYSGTTGYSYTSASGTATEIANGSGAFKFCQAYTHGIKTYLQFWPVINKVSTWTSLPGIARSGNSMTAGGTAKFSASIGKWDSPPINLSGFASTNWFKNGDRWDEQADGTYRRTEQWTYTPDGSNSDYGWIYASSAQQSGGGGS